VASWECHGEEGPGHIKMAKESLYSFIFNRASLFLLFYLLVSFFFERERESGREHRRGQREKQALH